MSSRTTRSGAHLALPLLLVVEDAEELYELYSDFLAGVGYAVEGSNNGVEVVQEARSLMPDLILMDLALPRISGWDAIRLLKSDEKTRHIPIIALAGHVQQHVAQLARQAGADAVLPKPCELSLLLGEIERILGHAAPTSHH